MKAFRKPKEDHTIDPDKAIRLFEDADLQAIFDPATFIPWAKKPQYWWAPMLGLYTGARVNEVCQLKLTDIIEERGVWCIAFQKTLDQDLAADPKRRRRSRQSMKGAGTTLLKRPQGERPSGPTSGKVRLHSWHSSHHRCRALSDVRKFRSRHIAVLNINSD